jgi:hypothetical protein
VNSLQRFENRLEQMISGAFARAFRSAVQPVEIAAALQREADNNAQIMSRNRRLVPNEFHVELSQGDLDRLAAYDDAMERELVEQLQDHADQQGYVFTGRVTVDFEAAEDLTTGRFRIRSRAVAGVTDHNPPTQVGMPSRRTGVTLEVNGSRHPLRDPGLVLGRGSDADLRINDPGVSRRHAKFTVEGDRVTVKDLGSTNGVHVDGRKVPAAQVRDGDTVRIGRTDITVHIGDDSRADRGGAGR